MSSPKDAPDPAEIRVLLSNNCNAKAKELCLDLIRLRPDDPDSWLMLAAANAKLGELKAVADCCEKVIRLQPSNATAYYNLGVALQGLGHHQTAEEAYRHAIRLQPGNASAFANLAAVLQELNRSNEALEAASQAVSLNPASPHAHNNLGLSLRRMERHEEAASRFQQALAINPNMAEAHYNLGLTYYALGKIENAISCHRQAIAINPNYADAYSDLGVAYQAQGNLREALQNYDHAVELRPDFADAHWNRSLVWLLIGAFEKGWPEYEWRWRRKEASPRFLPDPRWDGSCFSGKRLFIYAEQGLGDTIQFCRYLPLVKERGGYVIFESQPELFNLLQSCDGVDLLLQRGDPLPPFDMHAPLLSLPGIFQTTLESIPCRIPYLAPSSGTDIKHVQLLTRKSKQHIGIAWAGNPRHTNDRNRSCPLTYFSVLADVPNIQLFSLQKGKQSSELKTHDFGKLVTDLSQVLDNFADTAAAVAKLDLIVTVDTSIAHLAGALGCPVWLLLPFAPDWRWLRGREDSPWYPTMRLFRQDRPGNWEGVFSSVLSAFAEFAAPGQ